jgi:DNA-binding PadR family transcriptional regulator
VSKLVFSNEFFVMSSPQLKNGYTPIANELLEQIIKYEFPQNGGHSAIIIWLLLARKTYGYSKKDDAISLTQFELSTGLSRPTIVYWLDYLVKALLLVKKQQTNNGYVYTINKNYEEWLPLVKALELVKRHASPSKSPLTNTSKSPLTHINKKQVLTKTIYPMETNIQKIVNHFFTLKGWKDFKKEDFKKMNIIYSRYTKPAKDLLELCDGDTTSACGKLTILANWANSQGIDYGIETVIKKWFDIEKLPEQQEKSKKAFIDGDRAYEKNGDWYVIISTGEHKKYSGSLEKLIWK